MTPVDQNHRERAMTDFRSVLLVEAAAGTGKTSLMAGRIAMMLASGHLPNEIAAITFTELAASELARRIRNTVDALLRSEVPAFLRPVVPSGRLTAPQRVCLARAATKLDDLTATTIHGFCQAILRTHGVQADLDPGARVVDAAMADDLFLAELSAWFSRRLAADAPPEDPIVVLAQEIPLEVVGLIRELALLRRKHPDAAPVPPTPNARPDVAFGQAVDDFCRWQRSSAGSDRWAHEIAQELQQIGARYADTFATTPGFAALWRLCDRGPSRLFNKGLTLLSYDGAARKCGAHHEETGSDDAVATYLAVNHAWSDLVGHIATCLVCAVSPSLDQFLRDYCDTKRAAAVLDFDDLLLQVRELVRCHDDVRQAIGRRYKFILIDEFQDTDRVQNEILFSIAATPDRQGPWQSAKLRPGSLFLVGDPKQAIYRFRGADIEAYQQSCELIRAQEAGAILEVTANFRSQSAVIKHINRCFEDVFAKASQPRYVPLAPTILDFAYPIPCVSRFTIEIHTEGRIYAEMFREAEAERVTEICSRLIGNVMIPRADNSRSRLRPGDIALLSPGHTDLWRYERALERQGLAVSSQAGQTLMRRQETQDVLALLRVLADSSDFLAFGALMRGPLVGLSERELLDITAALPPNEASEAAYFTVRTDSALVQHPLARSVLEDLQGLRKIAPLSTPSLLLATAIERLNARVIMAARHKNRNARALANLDALIERARRYSVTGLRAFVRDVQADWERTVRVPEGRIDAAEDAIEIVTIHSAKGLEWPVVIPINSTTELYRGDQFVHRQSDNTLHWMLGGVAPPDLAAARAEESEEDADQRERIWYVACSRARDLLILPFIPQAAKDSWFSSINLRQSELPELDLSALAEPVNRAPRRSRNRQAADVFAAERLRMEENATQIVWRRPSEHDPDRLTDPLESVVVAEEIAEHPDVVGAGALRGVILHKLLEEFLNGELPTNLEAATTRANVLLLHLVSGGNEGKTLPEPAEMAETALRALALPDVAALRPRLVPELAIWAARDAYLVAGRADALAIRDGKIEVAIDWKSDINPTASVRATYVGQLRDYLEATGASRGALVFLTLGEIIWVEAMPPGDQLTA
jgi:ATP-dependent exoDNAse (exonuclease V) beta subunit